MPQDEAVAGCVGHPETLTGLLDSQPGLITGEVVIHTTAGKTVTRSIVLLGLMGTGKTTTGRLLSQALGLPMTDSDSYLSERYGKSAARIVAEQGVEVLHRHEAEHVLDALRQPPQVIAAGASVVEDPRVREALKQPFVVWLDAPDEVLDERVRSGSHRPDFDPETLRARREPYYRQLADLTVDVAANRPEPAAAVILDAIGAGSPRRSG